MARLYNKGYNIIYKDGREAVLFLCCLSRKPYRHLVVCAFDLSIVTTAGIPYSFGCYVPPMEVKFLINIIAANGQLSTFYDYVAPPKLFGDGDGC